MASSSVVMPLYQPLDTEVQQFPLLELHPAGDVEEIKCTLHTHQLDESPSYEALSYMWGSQRENVPILIGIGQLKVTVDLAAALRRLRNPETSRLLWIDQICINQSDSDEQASQVNLMRNLYENASRVVIWLGEGDETSERAMLFMLVNEESINFCFENVDAVVAYGQGGVTVQGSNLLHVIFNNSEYTREMEAVVQAIMIRPYFERYWVIQEIVLACDAVVQYGSRSLAWMNVNRFVNGILNYNHRLVDTARQQRNESSPIGYVWRRLRELQEYRTFPETDEFKFLFEPWYLIMSFRNCKATESSDRIYAWLGLCEQWRETGFAIDYARHEHETFKLFTRAMIEHDRSLSWLAHAGSPRSFVTLPSWVPDLELTVGKRPDPLVLLKGLYSADQGSEFGARFSTDSSSLFCKGVCIDRICFVTATMDQCLRICIPMSGGSFERASFVPSELAKAVTSRYGDALELEMQNLLTAGRLNTRSGKGCVRAPPGVSFLKIRDDFSAAGGVPSELAAWLNVMNLLAESTGGIRAVFFSEKGYMGLVPEYALEGDVVCVLFGSEVPVVLRREGDTYKFIGDCYATGLMDGQYAEILEKGEAEVQTFELR